MRHNNEDKKRFVGEWAASKLSRRKYANEIGVGYGTFVNWCKKYSESAASEIEGQGFVEVNKKIAPEQKRGIVIELEHTPKIIRWLCAALIWGLKRWG
jgi:transposase